MHSRYSLMILLAMWTLVCTTLAAKSATDWFYEGNVAYGKDDFAAAEAAYRAAIEAEASSGALFNLGNSLARQDRWAEAAFYYARAHATQPQWDAPRAALLTSAQQLGREEAYPLLSEPAALLPGSTWLLLALAAFWMALAGWLQYFILPRPMPFGRTVGSMALVLLLLCATALFQTWRYTGNGLIIASEAPLRLAPALASPARVSLAAGDWVRVLAESGDFLQVQAEEGAEGFVTRAEAGRLRGEFPLAESD